MRIFVAEYVCGGGLMDLSTQESPTSLRAEGAAMLRAIVSDLAEFADTIAPLDPRFSELKVDLGETAAIDPDEPLWAQWVTAAKSCDAAIVIAPESDGVLAKAVAMLRAAGVDVIAGSGDFLRVASDKLLTGKTLIAAGVAHPPYYCLSDRRCEEELRRYDQFIVKPRDGCGTQRISFFDSFDEARAELEENLILQARMPGRAVSIALVASPTQQIFLPAVTQQLCESTLQYAGGQGPLDEEMQRRATALASRAVAVMPPTVRGFVGLDLILGENAAEDCVIEINPRLTTSYVGLRRMINENIAARLFDLQSDPFSCCTSVDAVRWKPDGQVWINETMATHA